MGYSVATSPFLTTFRNKIRLQQKSLRTEEAYISWALRFIKFHQMKHPADLGAKHVEEFLAYIASERNVAASTQNQALAALTFLYKTVLERSDFSPNVQYVKRQENLRDSFTNDEAMRVLALLKGDVLLVAKLMYGSGLRLLEALRLRVKDIDFERLQVLVFDGKGGKNRRTMLPQSLVQPLKDHLLFVKAQHDLDLAGGFGITFMPNAMGENYRGDEWKWQYVFPSKSLSKDPRTGRTGRHHIHENHVQRCIREAVQKAGITRKASSHTFRHTFATSLIERGYDIKKVAEVMGHSTTEITERYIHVRQDSAVQMVSPLDTLAFQEQSAESAIPTITEI
ncbi:MAG: integron integrase [Candidatus Kapabacteria bacterium]|jgi:integron integrase|nr:integron integrase [Candidatus Kapabacteria bacterium]